MLANEVAFKCCYKKYGGYGYSHVLENIAPELRFKGVKQEQIDTMLIENPKEFLSY
jgi:phosphotriesterase-related protein